MMCAAVAGRRGRRVMLVDHAERLAEKIRISGGGRCNFTNRRVGTENFVSDNPDFCRSALAGYGPDDFIKLVDAHGIAWHEKHRGQLFCDDSSEDIIALLRRECDQGKVGWRMPARVQSLEKGDLFTVHTTLGVLKAPQLVIATGGMAIPQLGATDFGLSVARQFGLKVIEPRPALVPLVFDQAQWQPFSTLAGLSLQAELTTGQGRQAGAFVEDLLFTHRGLSGPAILQISNYWQPGQPINVDLMPGVDLDAWLLDAKKAPHAGRCAPALSPKGGPFALGRPGDKKGGRQSLINALTTHWPRRLAESWLAATGMAEQAGCRLADLPDATLRQAGRQAQGWQLVPSGTAGYKKAEVMRGGVDTRGINQKTMQARNVPGLFFIGEALDMTGWLGGYNFQWAWSSAVACGRAL
ncbi:aminoacetone oxidase family FAD-binding enzyme [Corticimicrobacter populi]|uniref:Aminoacetone oxidase family FAD-binding enzyme n=2 Tax=Corticimicrobacter populi TaxID=2175229 RepID=A0A2V1K0T1_9BURK|nr:aminoacetone oxidase family FAD-binding enzyme [Corticimicrobacter populi]